MLETTKYIHWIKAILYATVFMGIGLHTFTYSINTHKYKVNIQENVASGFIYFLYYHMRAGYAYVGYQLLWYIYFFVLQEFVC